MNNSIGKTKINCQTCAKVLLWISGQLSLALRERDLSLQQKLHPLRVGVARRVWHFLRNKSSSGYTRSLIRQSAGRQLRLAHTHLLAAAAECVTKLALREKRIMHLSRLIDAARRLLRAN